MEFYPSLADLEATVLATVHTVANAMSNVPDIQVSLNWQQAAGRCLYVVALPLSSRQPNSYLYTMHIL